MNWIQISIFTTAATLLCHCARNDSSPDAPISPVGAPSGQNAPAADPLPDESQTTSRFGVTVPLPPKLLTTYSRTIDCSSGDLNLCVLVANSADAPNATLMLSSWDLQPMGNTLTVLSNATLSTAGNAKVCLKLRAETSAELTEVCLQELASPGPDVMVIGPVGGQHTLTTAPETTMKFELILELSAGDSSGAFVSVKGPFKILMMDGSKSP